MIDEYIFDVEIDDPPTTWFLLTALNNSTQSPKHAELRFGRDGLIKNVTFIGLLGTQSDLPPARVASLRLGYPLLDIGFWENDPYSRDRPEHMQIHLHFEHALIGDRLIIHFNGHEKKLTNSVRCGDFIFLN